MEIPSDIKYIAPYIQRGQELSERDPIVSYYAQYYAAKMAISKGPSNKEVNAYLSHLLDKLEKLKTALGANNEAITSDLVGYAHIENFALKVFMNADNEDRAGKASKKTAKTFLAASIFLELLKTFDDLDPEVEGKIKYAKWKAADIMKALREGRTPTPGAPGEKQEQEDEEMALDEDMPAQPPASISEFPSPPSNFTAPLPGNASAEQPPSFTPPPPATATPSSPPPPTSLSDHPPATTSPPVTPSTSSLPHVPPPATTTPPPPVVQQKPQPAPQQRQQPVAAPAPVQSSTPATSSETPMLDPGSIAAAQKHAKWAISALNYDDIKTARTQLLTALNDLGYNQQNNFGY